MRRRIPLGPLAEREFRTFFIGQGVSLVGDGALIVALSFAVIEIGGGPADIGIVLGAGALSLVVMAAFGGVWGDRLPRHHVMVVADLVRLASQATAGLLVIGGVAEVWMLAVLQIVYGAGEAFFRPAATGLIPHTVSPGNLQQANALYGMTANLGWVLGPALAGVLVAVVGAGWALVADAASFAVSAAFLMRLSGTPVPARGGERTSVLREVVGGLREVRHRSWLWFTIAVASAWLFFEIAPLFVLGPIVAERELGGAGAWAAILSGYGVGAVLGGVVALRIRPRRPLFLAGSLVVLEAPLPALLALGVSPVPVLVAAAVVGGTVGGIFEALWTTTMQRHVPDEALARVSALDWMGSLALLPLGYAVAGPVAEALGVDVVLYAAAAAALLAGGALALHRGVRNVEATPSEVISP